MIVKFGFIDLDLLILILKVIDLIELNYLIKYQFYELFFIIEMSLWN